jgi:hypothetical protein
MLSEGELDPLKVKAAVATTDVAQAKCQVLVRLSPGIHVPNLTDKFLYIKKRPRSHQKLEPQLEALLGNSGKFRRWGLPSGRRKAAGSVPLRRIFSVAPHYSVNGPSP